jgi:hypothetical protein
MVLDKNFTLRTTKGQSVRFEKGTPVNVSPAIYEEAVAIGARRTDGGVQSIVDDDQPVRKTVSNEERKAAATKAFNAVIQDNERFDFTGAGTPTCEAISKRTGMRFDQVEVNKLWMGFQQQLGNESGN